MAPSGVSIRLPAQGGRTTFRIVAAACAAIVSAIIHHGTECLHIEGIDYGARIQRRKCLRKASFSGDWIVREIAADREMPRRGVSEPGDLAFVEVAADDRAFIGRKRSSASAESVKRAQESV